MDFLENKYQSLCMIPTEFNEHLPILYKYAQECESVLDLGMGQGSSSWTLLKGLVDNKKENKKLFLNDVEVYNIDKIIEIGQELNVNIEYEWINDLELILEETYDMAFIDTWHVYGQTRRELDKYSKIVNKYIIFPEVDTDLIFGQVLRNFEDPKELSEKTGYSIEDLICGYAKSLIEFLKENEEWKIKDFLHNNGGLVVLEKIK